MSTVAERSHTDEVVDMAHALGPPGSCSWGHWQFHPAAHLEVGGTYLHTNQRSLFLGNSSKQSLRGSPGCVSAILLGTLHTKLHSLLTLTFQKKAFSPFTDGKT